MLPQRSLSGLTSRRMLVCALLGFSSGLPFYVLVSLFPAWLRIHGVGLDHIAALNWLRAPYSWKFLWAPIIDRFPLPLLSRRRDWAMVTQLGLMIAIAIMGWLEPARSTISIAAVGLIIAVFSTTQDIAIDAYRRELLEDWELGFGNSLAVNLYRLAGVIPGGVALYLADRWPWRAVFLLVGLCMIPGMLGSWMAPPLTVTHSPRTLREATVGPIRSLFEGGKWRNALGLFGFLFLYKFGDNLATTLVTPFYLDLGYTLTEIGTLVKAVALSSMVVGSLVGGVIMARIGINRALWIFGLVQMLSILGFAGLSVVGRSLPALGAAVLFEYLGIGLGTAAFVAFIARATDKRFTATQYALLSSFVAIPGIAAGSFAGKAIIAVGYTKFFLICTAAAIPGLLMLPRVAPWNEPEA